MAALEGLGRAAGHGVVGRALEVEGAAVGGEDAEGEGGDGLAVVLAGGEVFDFEGGCFLVGGGGGGGQGGGAEEGGGGGGGELHVAGGGGGGCLGRCVDGLSSG